MMPQSEFSEPRQEQAGSGYGRYEGDQAYNQQHYEPTFEQPLREGPVGKVYPLVGDNKNLLRFAMAVVAMVFLFAFAVLCLIFVRGTGGWISFGAASLAIFIIAAVAIDKIK